MPILSVIVPVYNVADFLDNCILSIINQSFRDIEVICINDGSTDNSWEILQKWEKKDDRIRIFTQKNRGVSYSRNKGLKLALGKYISFIDSDDFLSLDMFSILLSSIQSNKLDVIGCTYQTYPNGAINKYQFKTDIVLTFSSLLKTSYQIQTSNDLCFCWRYVIRKEILLKNNLFFNEQISMGEDMIYMLDVFYFSQRILLKNIPLYNYRVNNSNSVMSRQKYNPSIESSLSLMYKIKKQQIKNYQIDLYSPYSKDLAQYTLKIYWPILIDNVKKKNHGFILKKDIKNLLNLFMIRDAVNIIKMKNIYTSWKEYLFYLAIKFKCTNLVHKYYSK